MGKKVRHVDIATDAGVKNGLGSWAAVIARVDGRGGIVEGSGVFRTSQVDSFIAEARAIANGLHIANKAGIISRGERVFIRCDNVEVVRRFSRLPLNRPLRPDVRDSRDKVEEIARMIGCELHFRHIKGHGDLVGGGLLALLNARADLLCCRELETVRSRKEPPAALSNDAIAKLSLDLIRRGKLVTVRKTVARLTGN